MLISDVSSSGDSRPISSRRHSFQGWGRFKALVVSKWSWLHAWMSVAARSAGMGMGVIRPAATRPVLPTG